MGPAIHPTAVVHASADLHAGVEIGPFCVIEEDVRIGAESKLGPYTHVHSRVSIGARNVFTGHVSIGAPPQDIKYKGEPTRVEIGDDNLFREFVTVHRGTPGGGGLTTVGSHNFLMAYSHVAHDCIVGSHVIFANGGTLAGHVTVGDHATIGALSAVHQFCRVGDHAFIGGGSIVTQDALPFVKTVGNRPAGTYGVNTIGLQRKGFSEETVTALQQAYRILVRSKLQLHDALERLDAELREVPEVRYFTEFVRGASKRGFVR